MTEPIHWEAFYTLAILLTLLAALVAGIARPAILFVSAMLLLLFPGIISFADVFNGLTNTTVLTIGALFIVAGCVQHVRLFSGLDRLFRSGTRSTGTLLFRVMGSTAAMSSVLNNTPIVAILYPYLLQCADKLGISASKLLIPLSYAAIVGGLITLFGTSTTLIVSGIMVQQGHAPFHFFQLAVVGIPASILVVVWFSLAGHRLLPDRLSNMQVAGVTGQTGGSTFPKDMPAPSGVYCFSGNLALAGIAGGSVPSEQAIMFPSGVYARPANSRYSEQVPSEPRLARGLQASAFTDWCVQMARAFWQRGLAMAGGTAKIWTLLVIVSMIGVSISGLYPIYLVVICSAAMLLATGMLPVRKIARSIHFPVLIVIATSLAMGAALETSGLAHLASIILVKHSSHFGLIGVLVLLYLVTNLLTELITNNAAAVLMVPVALNVTQAVGMDPHAAGVTVAVAASGSFLSPVGYQTNLMVMDPGGYRYTDYTIAGLPVTLILMIVTITVVSWRLI